MPTITVTIHEPSSKTAAGLKRHGLKADKSAATPGALVVLLADEGDVQAFTRFATDHAADDGLSVTYDMPATDEAAA